MKKLILASTATAFMFGMFNPAFADGVFDFMDPCIEQRDEFRDHRASILAAHDADIAAVEKAIYTSEYKEFWMKAKKKEMRSYFDDKYTPMLIKWGVTNVDAAYDDWFAEQLGQASQEDLDKIINDHFRAELKQVRVESRVTDADELERQKNELHKECKMDVGNQALRVTLTSVMTPINWSISNWESAKNESGELSKITKATTGISLDAMAKNGPLGGKNSEARKIVNSVAGGKNSEVRKALRNIDPTNIFR